MVMYKLLTLAMMMHQTDTDNIDNASVTDNDDASVTDTDNKPVR